MDPIAAVRSTLQQIAILRWVLVASVIIMILNKIFDYLGPAEKVNFYRFLLIYQGFRVFKFGLDLV
jgi:hypothetical protein